MAIDRIPMSKDGFDKLKAQLDHMKNVDSPRIANQIAEARAEGDLSENAEFDSAIEAQGMLEARMRDLEGKLASAQIVDMTNIKTSTLAMKRTTPWSAPVKRTTRSIKSSPQVRSARGSSAKRSAKRRRSPSPRVSCVLKS